MVMNRAKSMQFGGKHSLEASLVVSLFILEDLDVITENKFRILQGNAVFLWEQLGKAQTVFIICSEENKFVLRIKSWFLF